MDAAGSEGRRWLAALALLAAAALSACGPGRTAAHQPSRPDATAPPVEPSATPPGDWPSRLPASLAPVADPTPTPVAHPTPTPVALDAPPPAVLTVAGTAAELDGALGTFSWDGLTSDAPWIVPSIAVPAGPGADIAVGFGAGAGARSWTAQWAPVVRGPAGPTTGDGITGRHGEGPVRLAVPGPGGWGLRLEASFGEGRRASWYWRIEVR